jgi:hypothetical protein
LRRSWGSRANILAFSVSASTRQMRDVTRSAGARTAPAANAARCVTRAPGWHQVNGSHVH